MKYDIKTIEGALHIITITVNDGVDFTNYSVYGSCGGGCCCKHFIIEEQTNTQCKVVIPALSRGVYDYQLFAKQNDTNKEFLIISGQIIAEDRICDNANNSIDYKTTIADVTISADTVEVSVTIEGIQGEDGEKGDDGGYYIPSVSADGDLSWTATESDMPTVATVNIRGPQGEQGIQGIQGEVGPQGPQGEQGPAGESGDIEWIVNTATDTSVLPTVTQAPNTVAIGYNVNVEYTGQRNIGNTVVVGNNSTASANSVAIGEGVTLPTSELTNVAIGYHANSSGSYNVLIGGDSSSSHGHNVVIGQTAKASGGGDSVAIGAGARTVGAYGTAIGCGAKSANSGVAIGDVATINDTNGVAIGCAAQANWNGVSVGYNAQAVSDYTTAIGAYAANNYDRSTLIKNDALEVYFISHQSDLSSQYLDGESGIRIKDDYQDTYKKFSELLNGGGGGDTPETDTTSSFSWGDYYNYERKYKDCSDTSSMSNINSQWRKDLTENGEWNYVLENMNVGMPDFKYWYSDYSSDYGTLRSFNSYMGQVTDMDYSFQYCQELESWSCATPQCTYMQYTFQGCTKLKHFRGDLRNLQYAQYMFGSYSGDCTQLDLASVQHIANVINTYSGNIHIGVSNTLQGSSELETALQQIRDKGWTVEVYYSDNG